MRSERRKLREVQNVISIIIDEDMRKIYLGYLFLELGSLELYVYTICTRYNKDDYNCPQNYKMLELLFYVVKVTSPLCYN